MRVLIVCDFLFKYGSQQARSLARDGHDVAILFRSHALEFGGSTDERAKLLGTLRRENIKLFVLPGRIRSVSAVPKILELRRELDRWRPQIVHVHENLDPRLLALTRGYRTVFTVHDPVEHLGARPFTRIERWIVKRWLRRSERLVVHGQALADELAPIVGRARIVVIPHGTWPRSEPLPPPRSPSVLLFGRLEPYKGVEVLVEAMRLVWERRPDVKLVVAGNGPAARLVPADPRILLRATYISEEEVETLLACASLVVLPYTQASQSGVGLLAVGEGVPVVVSDLGALPDLAYEPSFVCEHGNPWALAQTIIRHVDDGPDVRTAVLTHALSHFSWEHAAELTTRLYEDVVGGSRMSQSPGSGGVRTRQWQTVSDDFREGGPSPMIPVPSVRRLHESGPVIWAGKGGTVEKMRAIEIDADGFAEAFARRSVLVHHHLVDHPLFTLDAIAELADRLPADSVRRERGDLPLANYGRYTDVGDGAPSATIRDVAQNGVRVSLRDIQQAPEYGELINECLDEVEPLVSDREGGMTQRAGYLFISAPASNTPMHFDVEHSFLLQIKGVKHVSVAAFTDDPTALQREFDRHVDGRENDFEAMQAVAETFTITPGLGVYLPSQIPHWVKTEAGISISFSIPFHTKYVEQAEAVSRINKRLRRLHLSPRPAGESESIDKTKAAVIRSWLKVRDKLPT